MMLHRKILNIANRKSIENGKYVNSRTGNTSGNSWNSNCCGGVNKCQLSAMAELKSFFEYISIGGAANDHMRRMEYCQLLREINGKHKNFPYLKLCVASCDICSINK